GHRPAELVVLTAIRAHELLLKRPLTVGTHEDVSGPLPIETVDGGVIGPEHGRVARERERPAKLISNGAVRRRQLLLRPDFERVFDTSYGLRSERVARHAQHRQKDADCRAK